MLRSKVCWPIAPHARISLNRARSPVSATVSRKSSQISWRRRNAHFASDEVFDFMVPDGWRGSESFFFWYGEKRFCCFLNRNIFFTIILIGGLIFAWIFLVHTFTNP